VAYVDALGCTRHARVEDVTCDRVYIRLSDRPRGLVWFDRHELARLKEVSDEQ